MEKSGNTTFFDFGGNYEFDDGVYYIGLSVFYGFEELL